MEIEKEDVISRIKFNNDLEFVLHELNQNKESEFYLDLCANIIEHNEDHYEIYFYDNSGYYSYNFNREGEQID